MSLLLTKNKELAEKNAALKALLNQGNDLTEAESNNLTALHSEVKALTALVNTLAEAEGSVKATDALLGDPARKFMDLGVMDREDSKEKVEIDKDGTAHGATKGLTMEQIQSISTKAYNDAYNRYLKVGQHGLSVSELKTLQVADDSLGGYLIPLDYLNQIIRKKTTPTRVNEMVSQFNTSRDKMAIPTQIWDQDDLYASGVRSTTVGEIPATGTEHLVVDPNFGLVTIDIYTDMLSGQLTNDMIEDSAFDVMSIMTGQFQEAMSLKKDLMILTGTGNGQQTGILAAPGATLGGQPQPAVVALGSPITADKLLDIAWQIPEQYEEEDLVYLFNKTNTARGIAQLKDSTNRYLFAYGANDDKLASARPREIAGYKFLYSGFMPNAWNASLSAANANAYPVIFGALKGYGAVNRVGLTIQVLRETGAKRNLIELVGRYRWGGQTIQPWMLKVGQVA